MFKNKAKVRKLERLNLIPILDAVFIFIFFLLMSAQFVDIHEIASDAPATATFDDKTKKKEPLNLILEIDPNAILVKTGLREVSLKRIDNIGNNDFDLKTLQKILSELKIKNIDEQSIILRPKKDISYKNVIKIVDSVQQLDKGLGTLTSVNTKGETITTDKLFNQIIFETLN